MSIRTSPGAVATEPPVGAPMAARLRWGAAALVAAWLVPTAAHLAGADWVLPLLLLAGVMSLQRAGRTVADRLVLAVAQLFGAVCAAGLLISVWPWHLHPVPIAGCAFTVLVGLAVATGRRPRVPLRTPASDVVTWLAVLAVAVLAVVPFAIRDLGGRIGIVATGEDFARHFTLYDVIGRIGGYAFLHRTAAAAYVPDNYGFGYPQGTHLLYAVLDRFARSSSTNADAVTGMDVLLWCHLGTYLFLALAVLWAVRRVAGPGADPAALLLVLGGVAAVLYFGDPLTTFLRGFPNETLGLAMVAILSAILARPLARPREQVVTVAAALVGISFAYHLYLPYALLVAAVWVWRRRRALPVGTTVVAAVVAAPLVVITPLENQPSGAGNLLLTLGTALPVDRPMLVLVVLAAVAGLLARGGWRAPARRFLTVELAAALMMVAALFAYQYAAVGHSAYYLEKLLHMLQVVALVGLGSTVRLLPRALIRPAVRVRYAVAVVAALAVAGVLAAAGGQWHAEPLASPGLRYGLGLEDGSPLGGREAVEVARRFPDAGGSVDVVLTPTPYSTYFGTLFTAALQRNYRYGEDWYTFLSPTRQRSLADVAAKVRESRVPVRFVVRDPGARVVVPGLTNVQVAEEMARRYPDKAQVLVWR